MDKVQPRTNKPIAGFKSGKLTVIQRVADKRTNTANLKVQVRVECECGNRLTIPFWYLVRPHSPPKTSCGQCNPKSLATLHPDLKTVWYMMNYRCNVPEHKVYNQYGGRGIKVCTRWHWDNDEGFKNFVEDMFPRPKDKSLDRENNMGHYEPKNCRWATATEQRNNQGREGPLAPDPD